MAAMANLCAALVSHKPLDALQYARTGRTTLSSGDTTVVEYNAMRILQSGDATFPAPAAWDEFVSRDPRGHLLQTWAWGELKGAFGWTPLRLAVEQDGALVAGAQVLFRRLGPLTMAYIPKGPVLVQHEDAVQEQLWQAIHRLVRTMRAISLKVEPEWYDEEEERRAWLERRRFRPSAECIQPRRTIIVDLARRAGSDLGPDETQMAL